MTVRRKFYEAFSLPGDSSPPYVDIPTQSAGSFAIVTQVEVMVRTSNGRRKVSAKEVHVDRYAADVDGPDRTSGNRLSNYRIPICGPRQTEVDYSRQTEPYTEVEDLSNIDRLGFRACVDSKDRASDEVWLRVAVETYVLNELDKDLR